jgi:hypothetical protein
VGGIALAAAVALALPIAGAPGGEGEEDVVELPAAGGPVVLELFTSQGCSSCPPAEGVLSVLGLDPRTRDRVVPLAFHVDYWNRLGWADPFSAPEWSARQTRYDRALGGDGPYTPQLVVDGRRHLNGAHGMRALQELADALRQPAAARLRLGSRREGDALTVEIAAEVTRDVEAGELRCLVALYESGLVTDVERGENAGRSLANDFIVRRLVPAFTLSPTKGARESGTVELAIHPEWVSGNFGIAAFVQDPVSMAIHGAVRAEPRP